MNSYFRRGGQLCNRTHHGWILLPGGMPKVELPEHLTDVRKGRCARLKDSSASVGLIGAWHWDSSVRIALAPGISCFEANQNTNTADELTGGGITPVVKVVNRSERSRPRVHRRAAMDSASVSSVSRGRAPKNHFGHSAKGK